MPRVTLPLDGFYESETLSIPEQECVNWYRQVSQSQGDVSPVSLRGCAGVSQRLTTGEVQQINRGAHIKSGVAYFLNGESLVSIIIAFDAEGVVSFSANTLGTIPGDSRVSMADNGTQLMVLVPGGNGYIIDESSGSPFVQITDPSFTANGAPQHVEFNSSFFVVTTDTKKFIRSDANDGTSWSALNVYSAESDPDIITAIHTNNNRVYIGGSETIEEFTFNGSVYQRTGFFIDKGVSAPFSMKSTNNSFMWIGAGTNESPAIWMLAGNQAQKASTTAIDKILQSFSASDINSAFSYSFAQNGAFFIGFSFPTLTLEFNTVTGKWNERKSQIVNDKGFTQTIRWRVNSVVYVDGYLLCGDSRDGRIGEISPFTYTEYGNEIIRSCVIQPLTNQGNAISITELEPTFQSGVGTLDIPNPKIRMSTSRTGEAFDDETSRCIGTIGKYNARTIWNRLGRFPREALIKFTMSDSVESEFIKLEARIKSGQRGN
jgi:hypothetical protein